MKAVHKPNMEQGSDIAASGIMYTIFKHAYCLDSDETEKRLAWYESLGAKARLSAKHGKDVSEI